jgi:hypothetical protein
VQKRDIVDNILLSMEMVHFLNPKTMEGNLILKLDLTKSFDRLSWSTLLRVLHYFDFDFDLHFFTLIQNCIDNN